MEKVVLAVDDNVMLLDLIHKMLASEYDVRTVTSAASAIKFLNSNGVDVILLDIEMPNVSGFDFLDDIRKIPSYLDVPIIIVSGNTGADFLAEAKNSTAFDVLSKPVTKDTLVQTIERALASANSNRA